MTDFRLSGKCRHFDNCSAPMCPGDTGTVNTSWFVGEPICNLRDVPEWVKRQRKIVKIGVNETKGCFTLPMLERRCIVRKTTTGMDSDGTEMEQKEAEKIWLDRHPPVKPKTDEQREKLAARMRFKNGGSS